ncbi:hypothetical protein ABIE26_002088 [Pedobacter africanus]|uniref:Uncharacterized protein n=1 Tax=Pedobacter africanus TaxID=151894 RepID=A0ACC6KYU8_9SPHI|nr:hypothetical protein [Pedobacter africanus]MDR6784524.1 hypothetical protein [Pedobacter africanus]
MNFDNIKNEKQKIISQMYSDLENTKEPERYFTDQNIEECSADLDKYVELLSKANHQQKEISKNIKWIFKSLSTFKEENEDPEFLWGFIYNGYTVELTDFILSTAFEFGLEKAKAKNIKTNIFHIKHNPHFLDTFRIYIGSTSNSGVVLEYKKKKSCFEFVENPYGETYGIPIFNLKSNHDYSELSFDVLTAGAFKTINLKAQKAIDKVLLKTIWSISQKNPFTNLPEPDFCNIEIELSKGVLTHLKTLNYDKKNKIINMFTKGSGILALVQELDATGGFQSSDNLAPHPEIVDEKFVIVDAVPDWKYYEIQQLEIKDNVVFVTTKNQKCEYENKNNFNVVCSEIESKTLKYEVKTYDFMLEILNDILPSTEPFKSRFES